MVEAARLGDDKAWTGAAGVSKEENWTKEARLGDGEAITGGIGVENSTLVVSARLVAPADDLVGVSRAETGSTEATRKKININKKSIFLTQSRKRSKIYADVVHYLIQI